MPKDGQAVFFRTARCLVLLSLLFVGTGGCAHPAAPLPPKIEAQGQIRVAFDSFTNVHYGGIRSLPGLLTTRTAVTTTLQLWFTDLQARQAVVDGTLTDMETFLRALPGPQDCDVSIVYLGSVQDAAGHWEFIEGTHGEWTELLGAAPPPAHPCRIVLLDTCHAAAVRDIPAWAERLGTVTLLASGKDEKTYQFAPSALSPIDVQRRCPLAWTWARTHLPPDWDRHISFLGLIWMDTTARTTVPPVDTPTWTRFLQECALRAQTFRETTSKRWSSTVQIHPPYAPANDL